MSHNYIACHLCRWMMRAWGRRSDPDRALAHFIDHIEYVHRVEAQRIGAAAVSAVSQEEQSMSQDVVHHTHITPNPEIPHDHEHGVDALANEHHHKMRLHGHTVHSHSSEPHTKDGQQPAAGESGEQE